MFNRILYYKFQVFPMQKLYIESFGNCDFCICKRIENVTTRKDIVKIVHPF